MGQWALAAGKVDSARTWFRKAFSIDAINERTLELGRSLITFDRPLVESTEGVSLDGGVLQ